MAKEGTIDMDMIRNMMSKPSELQCPYYEYLFMICKYILE